MSEFDNKPQVLFGVLDKEEPTWPNVLKGPNHPVAPSVIPLSYSSYIIKLERRIVLAYCNIEELFSNAVNRWPFEQ